MIQEVLKIITNNKTVVFTGSGVSAESGIPTFRGKAGLWEKYNPRIYATLPEFFHTLLEAPEKIAAFLIDFYEVLLKAEPNPAHYALAKLEEQGHVSGTITQNIDNLHQFSGSKNISELHGNSYRFVCRACPGQHTKTKKEIRGSLDKLTKDKFSKRELRDEIFSFMGRCSCGRRLVTSVVFFGQGLPDSQLSKAYNLVRSADVFLCIGTSGVVYPAAGFISQAKDKGAKIIEINPEHASISGICDIKITKPAGIFFSEFLERMK